MKRVAFFVRECLAVAVWLSIFIKVFVYDIDLLFVNKVPLVQRFYAYKFFFVIGLVAVVWGALGTRRAWKVIGYIAVYPLILLLWRIPKLLFKNWALLLIFAPAIESVIITLKRRFILGSFAILFALAISLTQRRSVLLFCMAFLSFYLLVHYILRLRVAFRPTSIFANIAPTIGDMWRQSIKTYKQNEFNARSGPAAQPADYPKKHIENVKNLYLQNLFWTYFGKSSMRQFRVGEQTFTS